MTGVQTCALPICYKEFKSLYPYLELYTKEKLAEIEPSVVYDKDGNEIGRASCRERV